MPTDPTPTPPPGSPPTPVAPTPPAPLLVTAASVGITGTVSESSAPNAGTAGATTTLTTMQPSIAFNRNPGDPHCAALCVSGSIALAAGQPALIDLHAYAAQSGTIPLSICRDLLIWNTGQTPITVYQAATNGWAGTPIPPYASAWTIAPGAWASFPNPTAAGWPVSATSRAVAIDPGNAAGSAAFRFLGE